MSQNLSVERAVLTEISDEAAADMSNNLPPLLTNNIPPLSSLRNPTREYIDANYTKCIIQKYCSQLNMTGIWSTKAALIEKLMDHFANNGDPQGPSRSSHQTTANVTRGKATPSPPCSCQIHSKSLWARQGQILKRQQKLSGERPRNRRAQNKTFSRWRTNHLSTRCTSKE